MSNDKNKNADIDPADLPQSEVFKEKEVFQHPQAADWGKPLDSTASQKSTGTKENDKTSKEEGLNEAGSEGDAGAFEGFEDHGE